MTSSIAVRIRERIGQLRMDLLGYRYDYDRRSNERIVTEVFKQSGGKVEDPNPTDRRRARTIAQYRAQLAMRPKLSIWLFEFASFIGLPLFVLLAWALNLLSKHKTPKLDTSGIRLVFAKRWRSNPEIFSIPDEIGRDVVATHSLEGYRLSGQDVGQIMALMTRAAIDHTPFPFQLALKCAIDLAKVRAALRGMRPKFIVVYWEFSCSLSFITQVMSTSETETYNVMHGDKFYYAKHAFFEVTRCYCWNQFYVDLFTEEYARADFRLFQNQSFLLTEEEAQRRKLCQPSTIGIAAPHLATLTQDHNQQAMVSRNFSAVVNTIADQYPVKIRPHPFYDVEFQKFRPHLSSRVLVETHKTTTPREFLIENEIIIGTVSTLLLEAANLGFTVIMLKTEVMKSVESYHYLYRMKNVHTATLTSLPAVVASIDAERALRQT